MSERQGRGEGRMVTVDYTNWRGSRSVREIEPLSLVEMAPGADRWHPTGGHAIVAVDPEDGIAKHFALAGLHAWGREAVDRLSQAVSIPRSLLDGGTISRSGGSVTLTFGTDEEAIRFANTLTSSPTGPNRSGDADGDPR